MCLLRHNHQSFGILWFASCLLAGLATAVTLMFPLAEEPVKAGPAAHTYNLLPLYFIENRGQLDDRITYYVQGHDKTIYFTPGGLTYSLRSEKSSERWILKLDFVGANPHVRPHGEKQTQASFNYFSGRRENWHTGIRTYHSIVYADLWPGIDLTYEGTLNRMKYAFVVKPGADPNQIRLAYRGADRVAVNSEGELEVSTPEVTFNDEEPVSFQRSNSGRESGQEVGVEAAYRIEGRDDSGTTVYGFQIGEYDRSRELLIDPAVLVYAGYIGGTGQDYGIGIAVDAAGNAYVTGLVDSPAESFPVTVGPDLTYGGLNDAFVAKIKADGTGLVYCGYIGGAGRDQGYGITVDGQGYAYVAGLTTSDQTTFPVLGGPGLTHSGFGDAFVAKIQPDGTGLVYCGYIGGNDGDGANSIAVDNEGNAYVTGFTGSFQGFPALVGPDLSYNLNVDAFVAKVKADGTGLVYCGFIGGALIDQGNGIKVDAAGNAYIVGNTSSNQNTFPVVVGPDLSLNVTQDVFVAKVRADGTGLTYCGYIGGRESEFGNGIAIDSAGNAYIGGWTTSSESSFPVKVGPDLTFNGSPASPDAFVAKVRFDGTGLDYCGYIGGNDFDQGFALAIDNQ
jgi:Beta-propeller repeat